MDVTEQIQSDIGPISHQKQIEELEEILAQTRAQLAEIANERHEARSEAEHLREQLEFEQNEAKGQAALIRELKAEITRLRSALQEIADMGKPTRQRRRLLRKSPFQLAQEALEAHDDQDRHNTNIR